MSSPSVNGLRKMPTESKNHAKPTTASKVLAWDGVVVSKAPTNRSAQDHLSPKQAQRATVTKPSSGSVQTPMYKGGGLEFKTIRPKPVVSAAEPTEPLKFKPNQTGNSPRFESGENINTSKAIEGIKVPIAPELPIYYSQPPATQDEDLIYNPTDTDVVSEPQWQPESIDGSNSNKYTFPNLTMTIKGYGSELLNGLRLSKPVDHLPDQQTDFPRGHNISNPSDDPNTELFDLTFYHGRDNAISSTIFPANNKDSIYVQSPEDSKLESQVGGVDTKLTATTATFATSVNQMYTSGPADTAKTKPDNTLTGGRNHPQTSAGFDSHNFNPNLAVGGIKNQTDPDLDEQTATGSILEQNQAYLFKQNSALHRSIPTRSEPKAKFIPFVGQTTRKRLRPIPAKSKLNMWENLESFWNRTAKNMAGSRGGALLTLLGSVLFSRVFAVGLVSLLVLIFMGNLWMSTRSTNQSSQASQQQQVVVPPTSRGANFGPQVPLVSPDVSSSSSVGTDPFFDAPGFTSSTPASGSSNRSSRLNSVNR